MKINKTMIATHDTVLYTVLNDTELEMAKVLFRHDHIDVNLKNRWLEDFLILVAKGGGIPIANGVVVDGRRSVGNVKRSLDSPRIRCIRRAIQSMIEDHNSHRPSLAPSLWGRIRDL
jgi:hypothetical protein